MIPLRLPLLAAAAGVAVAAVVVTAALTGGAGAGANPHPAAPAAPAARPAAAPVPALPPANAPFDYQIGGAYPPPAGVRVVSRDRNAAPAAGLYTICYVNAFQVQQEELSWWKANHDDLLLKDRSGRYVVDTDWNENLIDVSTAAKRQAVAAIVGGWITGCASSGFQAVEPDNIDSYQRSKGLLTQAEAVSYLTLLAETAHAHGLAIAQKNTGELGTAGRDTAHLDFAIVEECGHYDECGDFTAVYGNHVIDIEYARRYFTAACASVGASVPVVLRDLDVTAPGSGTYQYDSC
jgi:Glycoside-hydrolase family GH114